MLSATLTQADPQIATRKDPAHQEAQERTQACSGRTTRNPHQHISVRTPSRTGSEATARMLLKRRHHSAHLQKTNPRASPIISGDDRSRVLAGSQPLPGVTTQLRIGTLPTTQSGSLKGLFLRFIDGIVAAFPVLNVLVPTCRTSSSSMPSSTTHPAPCRCASRD